MEKKEREREPPRMVDIVCFLMFLPHPYKFTSTQNLRMLPHLEIGFLQMLLVKDPKMTSY